MCGIVGLLDDSTSVEYRRSIVRNMAASVRHRGPDGDGEYVDGPLAIGHRRLAIIDRSATGDQPMTSRSGRWTVSFNGEIYNHRELRSELAGTVFRGQSDTESLIEAIDALGLEQALQRCNGMFALAAWDSHERRLFLARDRLGEKPLYWTNRGGRLAFASELRALRLVPDLPLEVDPSAVASVLRWSFIPAPHTIYVGVHQLQPGTYLDCSVQQGRVEVSQRSWWSLAETVSSAVDQQRSTTPQAAAEALEPLLADSVAIRLQSDVPVGALLSGGIDSALVASFAQEALGQRQLRTFTVAMPDSDHDESAHAASIARHIGTTHSTITLSRDEAFDELRRLSTVWDEPFADPSMLPTALLCREVGSHVSVCLGGDGGDELFAGYNRHAVGASLASRFERWPAFARKAAAGTLLAIPPGAVDAVARRLHRITPDGRRLPNLGGKMHKVGALLRGGTDAWETLAGVWPSEYLGATPYEPVVQGMDQALDPISQMMLIDTAVVLPDQMLVKLDRASMAASLELRPPLLDHRLLEWAWTLPIEAKAAGGVGKLVLRQLAERRLPPEVFQRPKLGFDPPIARWLRHDLRDWAEDLLAAPHCVAAGWIDREALQRTWTEHLAGRRNHDYRIWSVLMIESWLESYATEPADPRG